MDKKLFAELKVGDKVLVRDDLQVCAVYGEDSFESGMKHFIGKVGIVAMLRTNSIRLEEVEQYNWTPEMLVGKVITEAEQEEAVELEKAPHTYAVGDTVKIENNCNPICINWHIGTIVTVVALHGWTGNTYNQDGSPLYTLQHENGIEQVATETQIKSVETDHAEDTEKKHKYAVGQKVRVTNNGRSEEEGLVWCCWSVGKEVTVIALEGFYENGEPEYKCVDGRGMFQYIPESQLESADSSGKHLDIEVGKVYTALTNLGTTWVIEVEAIDSNKVCHKGALCCNDDNFYKDGWFLIDNMIEMSVATAEQKEQLLRAKVDAGVLSAEELPFNNPELQVGKIYMDDDGGIFRYMKDRKDVYNIHTSVGTALDNSGDFYNQVKYYSYMTMHNWRAATAVEQKKLEDAEKAHGCDYSNAFVNEKGTVIHVGGYYVGKSLANPVIMKITEISGDGIRFTDELYLDGEWADLCTMAGKITDYVQNLRPATPAEINLYEKALELKEAVAAVKSE